MNLLKIVLYSVSKKDFFKLLHNINCEARWYVAFTDVDKCFDIERVEKQRLYNVGLGIKISRPVIVGRGLLDGDEVFASLSHHGVFAISNFITKYKYQLTDFMSGRQIVFKTKGYIGTGFYDDSMVVLTDYKPLGVCLVKDMFLKKNLNFLKFIGDEENCHLVNASFLHSTRVLRFVSATLISCEFNVDTQVIRKLDIEKKNWGFVSLTGIDIGVKGLFSEHGNGDFDYSFNNDNSISLVSDADYYVLYIFIPSSSDPRDLNKGMKIHEDGVFYTNTAKKERLKSVFLYRFGQSIVRLYQDIFLVHDEKTHGWCLVKIVVP